MPKSVVNNYPKGERLTEAQVLNKITPRAGCVRVDKRVGKIYEKGKAPVDIVEEEPAAKKAKKSVKKKSA